ncbi:MAG: substrate-binding domain-containing protein [Pseudomonadota bacterium]|nr:substrate-binding domain-containing protein [Pseudomonadota bacterium]
MIKHLFFSFLFLSITIAYADTVTIQSTTSTRDSGLYKYLLPFYPDYHKTQIKVIAVGTGQAMANAQNCDGNILIVHDKKRESEFMENNYGSEIHKLMFNDYVIVGPAEDVANATNSLSASDAFTKIYNSQSVFISRSDSSGTHAAEMSIWDKTGLDPSPFSGSWYLETGQGMGPSLNIATSLSGYILTDRSSWLRYQNKLNHVILYENPKELRNDYSMILINHNRCNNLSLKPARNLFNWLKSVDAADLIKDYQIKNTNVFYID